MDGAALPGDNRVCEDPTKPRKATPMTSIEQARKEVDRCVQSALLVASGEGPRTAAQAETALWTALLALGRALMGLFFATQARAALAAGGRYELENRSYQVVGVESTHVGTRFGKVEFERPVGRVVGAARMTRDLPLDRQLGLVGGFTPLVVTTMARLSAMMAFAPARTLHESFFGWSPSSRSVLRMVDATGPQARAFLDEAQPPEGDGEVLVMLVDGKGAAAISSREYARRARPRGARDKNGRHARRRRRRQYPRTRRGPGKKSKNAKVAVVGVLYTLRRGQDGRLEGPINKRVYATFESHRALFTWLADQARRRGYGTKKFEKVQFIADGADTIWSLQREFFPDAEVCLDWYHVVEKLWKVGKAICRNTRRERTRLEAWVAEQKRRLRKGQLEAVLEEIRSALRATPVTGPGNKYRREVLDEIAAHFEKNAERMQYARLRRQDLDISSGAAEGAVRHLIGMRLDGPGMRWSRDRAEAVLHLRCVLLNGLWEDFERHLAGRPLRLAAQPVPTRTHDAVVKKAA